MANLTIGQRITRRTRSLVPGSARARLRRFSTSTPGRVLSYALVRAILLALSLVVGVYVAVIIANLGGFIDEIIRDRITKALVAVSMAMADAPPGTPPVDFVQLRADMEAAAGLNQPFLLRCVRWTVQGLLTGWRDERILAALPNTLLLFGTASLILFFLGLGLSLYLSRHYGSLSDRLLTALSPISAAPSWAHGLILIMIFSIELHLLPFSGLLDDFPPAHKLGYVLVVGKHMILPVSAILLSTFFQVVYAWRSFFVLHSSEDHVEMATALGLSPRHIERRDVLRPALPYLITSFSLLLLGFWQSAIILEQFFAWPGVGKLYLDSLLVAGYYNPETAVNLVVIYAYFLALTVFVLDIVYALVDPRVKLSAGARAQHMHRRRSLRLLGRRFVAWLARIPQPHPPAVRRRPSRSRRRWTTPAPAAPPAAAGVAPPSVRVSWFRTRFRPALDELLRYPSAFFGLAIILALVASSVTTMLVIPYQEVVDVWRGGAKFWYHNPARAQPVWVNLFRAHDLPPGLVFDSRDPQVHKQVEPIAAGMNKITISFPFDYPYDTFPRDLALYFKAHYEVKKPHVAVTWLAPGGRETELGSWSLHSEYEHHFSLDERLKRQLGDVMPAVGLFADPTAPERALPGRYEMRVTSFVFEPDSAVDVEFVLLGQVSGLAGTDHKRRDLIVPLLWGMPIALAIGLVGAVLSSFATMLIAAVGAWFGGWVDSLIQRITEVNVMIPVLPMCITAYFFYRKSVWFILGAAVLLSIFGSALKNYRAAFLQAREAPYIDAARAYGAGSARLIVRYLMPRILPILVPQLVMLVPGYVFLEATVALLGIGDPLVPTWGQMIHDALKNGAFGGYYYWVLEPIALLMLTGFAFALLGFALERILDPRLRDT